MPPTARRPAAPPLTPTGPIAHVGYLWMEGPPELLDSLARDPVLAPLVLARPAPELLGLGQSAYQPLVQRLARLGHTPREVAP